MIRRYLAAPTVGLVADDDRRSGLHLADRVANGDAFPGERVVRLPRRFFRANRRSAPEFWSLKGHLANALRA